MTSGSFGDPAIIATFTIALVTLCLVGVTLGHVRLARHALELSIQPLLADAPPAPAGAEPTDVAQFGPPGRLSVALQPGQFWYQVPAGSFQLTVAFRNIGAGIAAIKSVATEPSTRFGSVWVTHAYVPVGEQVRVNVSKQVPADGERFATDWWAMEGFAVCITYSDAQGKRELVSRALIRQSATHQPFVESVEVTAKRRYKRKTIVVGHSSA